MIEQYLKSFSVEKYCYECLLLGMHIDGLLDGLKTYRQLFIKLNNDEYHTDFDLIIGDIDKLISAYEY